MKILKLEHRQQKVAPVSVFARRLAAHILIAFLLIAIALFMGIAGYHWLGDLSWVDALLNASMILGGMGPVNALTSAGAKVFASLYALFCGLVFIAVMGIVLAPVAHRMLHKFHVDEKDI